LNVELFIARRVFSQKENKKGISNRIVSIAVASISLGLAIMIISVGVLLGFKSQIREKIIGFGAHFQVVNFDSNQSYETTPIEIDSLLIQSYRTVKQVTHIQFYATKPGMIKTDDNIHGIILKGVDENYDWTFFSKNLTDGKLPALTKGQLSNEVLISEKISKLLKLNTGDPLFCYFYNEGESAPRSRRFSISGIYRTSLEDFDQLFVFSDIKQIQALNNWATNEVSGYELLIDDFKNIDMVFPIIRGITLNAASEHSMLKVFSVLTRYPALFDWLSILDVNVWVLLFLMIGVAGINMISGLLIIIIERTRMIGILKALGFPNLSVRKVFLYLTAFLSIKGMIWGNVIGIGLCILQYSTGLIRLNPELYYIDTVPIAFNALFIFAINLGSLLSIIAMIILPTVLISRITPVEAIAVE
jgi:lipoprotein-releasing system permease protein